MNRYFVSESMRLISMYVKGSNWIFLYVIGIYNQQAGDFKYQSGPVITNILLADEINRTIPRTQSSLLESMEEGQVTVDGHTYLLPRPFFVVATQNPLEAARS